MKSPNKTKTQEQRTKKGQGTMAKGTKKDNIDETTGEVLDEETGMELTQVENQEMEQVPELMDDLVEQGFQVVKTIKAGNPLRGCVPAYCGQLLSGAASVQASIPDGKGGVITSDLKSYAVHPATLHRDDKGNIVITPNPKITVRLIAPTELAGDLSSLLVKMSDTSAKRALFAYRWKGKGDIKGGERQLNRFDFIEKLEA
jgi:hypothetical protein